MNAELFRRFALFRTSVWFQRCANRDQRRAGHVPAFLLLSVFLRRFALLSRCLVAHSIGLLFSRRPFDLLRLLVELIPYRRLRHACLHRGDDDDGRRRRRRRLTSRSGSNAHRSDGVLDFHSSHRRRHHTDLIRLETEVTHNGLTLAIPRIGHRRSYPFPKGN